MELTLTDLRMIIQALEYQRRLLEQTQAQSDACDDEQADSGNDLYALEILLGCLQTEYQQRFRAMTQAASQTLDKTPPAQCVSNVYNADVALKQAV